MVEVRAGDMVTSGGVDFHIKASGDGKITWEASDTGEVQSESFSSFTQRCQERGNIIIKPQAGKFENERDWDERDVFSQKV